MISDWIRISYKFYKLVLSHDFHIQKPFNIHLQSLVDYYFYLDIPVSELKMPEEYIVPFPRITFGYFFEHPFLVTNHTKKQNKEAKMVISRISTDRISVRPMTDQIRILGARVRPYTLAHLTNDSLSGLPWLIDTVDLFKKNAVDFGDKVAQCADPNKMFAEVENIFLKTLLTKNLDLITEAVDTIESHKGTISVSKLAERLHVTNRTLRNHFYRSIGCSPKDYLHLVKLKQAVFQISDSDDSLTAVSYDQDYADQAHFTNSVKNITGVPPKKIRENLPDFRFLQF